MLAVSLKCVTPPTMTEPSVNEVLWEVKRHLSPLLPQDLLQLIIKWGRQTCDTKACRYQTYFAAPCLKCQRVHCFQHQTGPLCSSCALDFTLCVTCRHVTRNTFCERCNGCHGVFCHRCKHNAQECAVLGCHWKHLCFVCAEQHCSSCCQTIICPLHPPRGSCEQCNRNSCCRTILRLVDGRVRCHACVGVKQVTPRLLLRRVEHVGEDSA